MLLTIGLVLGVVFLFYVFVTWNNDYWRKRNVPGPKPKFFAGNFPGSLMQTENQLVEIDRIYKDYKKQHPFVGVFSMRTPQILLLAPELIKDVLIKNFKNFHDNEFGDMIDKNSDPLFGRNPFMLKGEEWKEKRAEVTPAFTNTRIKALHPLIEEVCSKMTKYVNQMNEKGQKDGLDTRELAAKFTTDAVSICVYAMDAGSFTKEKPEIREAGARLFRPSMKIIFMFMLHALIPITKKFVKFNFISKDLEDFFTDLMNKALTYRKEHNIKRMDYLDHLIQMQEKKKISDLDMAAHTITFFLDGFETSSIFISHALYQIAANTDAQEKLRAEIESKTAEDGGKLSYETLIEMPYLEQVCMEALRMYPPAAFTNRKCTIPIEVEGSKEKKVLIEKEMSLLIPIHSLHHDNEYYENPDTFNPDRFAPENGGVKEYRDKGVFMPFGDGPRICLGMRFALCQSKLAIAELVKNFKITVNKKTIEPIVIDPKEFLTCPKGGYWLNYTAIKN